MLDDKGSGTESSAGTASSTGTGAAAPALREFLYNAANRMSEVRHDGAVAMQYRYNGLGEQVLKFNASRRTVTVYDESGRWIGDYDSTTGNPIQQVIWLHDLPVGVLVSSGASQTLYYIEPDMLGTPRVVLNPTTSQAVWRWDLTGEAFGDTAPNQDPDGDGQAFVFDMRFPGQRFDAATGMNYNYFRDYEAGTGRYSQSDPIGLLGGVSTYGYVGGMPTGAIDSFGLKPGDCYRSPQQAAANAIADINPTSISENREYAGWIYRTENGWYSYTKPNRGTPTRSGAGPKPVGGIGVYHTHAAWDPRFVINGVDWNEIFSRSPYGNDLNIPVGQWAFLGTPRGRLWQYENNGRNSVPRAMKSASPGNSDSCGCVGRNDYDDLIQVWKRFLFRSEE